MLSIFVLQNLKTTAKFLSNLRKVLFPVHRSRLSLHNANITHDITERLLLQAVKAGRFFLTGTCFNIKLYCLSLLKLIAANDLHKLLESSCYVVSIRKLLVDRFDLLGFEEAERLVLPHLRV